MATRAWADAGSEEPQRAWDELMGWAEDDDPYDERYAGWTVETWDDDRDIDERERAERDAHRRPTMSERDTDRAAYQRRQNIYRAADEHLTYTPYRVVVDERGHERLAGGEVAYDDRRHLSRERTVADVEKHTDKAIRRADGAVAERLRERPVFLVRDDDNLDWNAREDGWPSTGDTPSQARVASWLDTEPLAWAMLDKVLTTGKARDRYRRIDRDLRRIEARCSPEMAEQALAYVLARFPDFQQWLVTRQNHYSKRGRKKTTPEPEPCEVGVEVEVVPLVHLLVEEGLWQGRIPERAAKSFLRPVLREQSSRPTRLARWKREELARLREEYRWLYERPDGSEVVGGGCR